MIQDANITTNDNNTITISKRCLYTKKQYSVTISRDEYDKWLSGERIQNAMPNISAGDREFLISGISPEGWRQMFG